MHAYWLDLGLTHYTPAFAIQEQAFAARMAEAIPPTVILQENPPTFTIGRSGSRQNVLASPQELAERGIEVLEVNRGGDVTYHGPGQIVASPLLYLGDVDLNANQYMHRLEDVVIELLELYGLHGSKKPDYPGVWLDSGCIGGQRLPEHSEKIGAVGIAVKHGYTFHGFSLNVNLDLSPYELINPCGVPRMPVTSLKRALGREIPMMEVRARLREIIGYTFRLDLSDITWAEMQTRYPGCKEHSIAQANAQFQT